MNWAKGLKEKVKAYFAARPTKEYETARTKQVSQRAMNAGLTQDELDALKGKKKAVK